MDPLKGAKALPLLHGFMVFVTYQPWTFQAPLFRVGHFLLRKQKYSLSDARKTGWNGSKIPAQIQALKKIG
jgi:hypothetical protein